MFLVTANEMRELDRKAIQMGVPALLLMENAGKAVAREAASLVSKTLSSSGVKPVVAVLAGPGQNGGDGLCAARHLSSMGYDVRVAFFGEGERLPTEARINYDALRAYPVQVLHVGGQVDGGAGVAGAGAGVAGAGAGVADGGMDAADAVLGKLTGADVIVDALLGTGQRGDPRPPLDSAVCWANRMKDRGVPVVACDVPTGLDADTGGLFHPTLSASVTVTMGFPKVGLYSYPGRRHSGRVVVESLGLPPTLLSLSTPARAVFLDDARGTMPSRLPDHHKGMSGHVTVAAGSLGMAGAAVLAAKAALRAGAGTVTLICPAEVYQVSASMVPEVMVLPCGNGPSFGPDGQSIGLVTAQARRSSCVALGPGLGRGTGQTAFMENLLPQMAAMGVPCLIDADGLNAVASLGGLSYLASLKGKFMLTPHPGELAHLMGVEPETIAGERVSFVRSAASESKSFVCLKGAGTCVANSSGELRINTSGDPAMATAGSGDVLSGTVAGLVSQGLPPFDALWLGVFWHGMAGEMAREKAGSYGILAGDISEALPEARKVIEGR